MDKIREMSERYYRGETTIAEEKILREKFRQGSLTESPVLAYEGEKTVLPDGFTEKFRQNIQKRSSRRTRQLIIAITGIAAMLILLVSVRGLFPSRNPHCVQLSDNTKRTRFEDALRIIGNVLDEQPASEEKILYEDCKLIIVIE